MGRSHSKTSGTESNTYKCDPGLCVIMNNTVFNKPQLHELKGGKKDEKKLEKLFKELGFTVMVHQNLTAEKMKSTAEGYSRMTHYGVFFLIILSHGGEGDVVYGTDGKKVEVDQLKELFYATNCPSLAGIPKIFLIDACRGSRNEGVYHSETKSATKSTNFSNTFTDSADFYTIFASTRGTTAGIDPVQGSLLTRNFVDIIREADRGKKFVEIMTSMKGRIHETKIQTAEINSTFTKFYYIKRYQVTPEVLQKRFTDTVHKWLQVRKMTIDQVRETATELERHCHNVKISTTAGNIMATGGSAVFVIGVVLAPFTFGESLAFALIGAGTGAVGGVTSIGASIVDKKQKKVIVKKIQKQVDYDNLQVEVIQQMAEDIKGSSRILQNIAGSSTVTIPINLAEIIQSHPGFGKGSETEVIRKLYTLANELENRQRV